MPERAGKPLFTRAVLGLNGAVTDPLVVRYACELAKPHGSQLVALHVVEVDWTHDLAEDLASSSEQASTILDLADAIAEKYGLKLETDLLQARDVGAALVDEAAELAADLIVIGLPYRKKFGGDFQLGRTVPYVLASAGCQVVVVREPIPVAEQPAPLVPQETTAGGDGRRRAGRLLSAVRGRR